VKKDTPTEKGFLEMAQQYRGHFKDGKERDEKDWRYCWSGGGKAEACDCLRKEDGEGSRGENKGGAGFSQEKINMLKRET